MPTNQPGGSDRLYSTIAAIANGKSRLGRALAWATVFALLLNLAVPAHLSVRAALQTVDRLQTAAAGAHASTR